MTATDELRRMLDEHGVEYRTYGTTDRTWFEVGNISWFIIERENGNLAADAVLLTPEQAIAATLGSCNCSNNCTNSERTGTCLPHFWTHDGTLHVELPKLPESISVRLPDQRDREVGSARVWRYTLDAGTCELINAADDLGRGTSSCMCFECGYTALDDWWDEFKYCPNCGRRVEVDDG